MMKAIFKGQTIVFDENDQEDIIKLADAIGYSVEYLTAIIQKMLGATGSFTCSIKMAKDKFNELSESLDDMIEKMQYEHVNEIGEKPEYCTFKSRLKPYDKRRFFQRPVFWNRVRSRLYKKPP